MSRHQQRADMKNRQLQCFRAVKKLFERISINDQLINELTCIREEDEEKIMRLISSPRTNPGLLTALTIESDSPHETLNEIPLVPLPIRTSPRLDQTSQSTRQEGRRIQEENSSTIRPSGLMDGIEDSTC